MMLIDLLRRNQAFLLGFCLLLLLSLWVPQGLHPAATPDGYRQMAEQSPWLRLFPNAALWVVPGGIATLVAALMLLFLNYRHPFFSPDDFLLPLLYLLLASALPATRWASGAQAAAIGLSAGVNYLLHTHRKQPGLAELFTSAFCFSLSALFFPPALLWLLLLPVGLLLLRPIAWRDWVVWPAGAALPVAYLFLYEWLTLHDSAAAACRLLALLPEVPAAIPSFDRDVLLFFGLLAALLLAALLRRRKRNDGTKTKVIYTRLLFGWMLLFSVAGMIFYPHFGVQVMPVMALPLAVILARYFAAPRSAKRKLAGAILLLAAIVFLQF
jgi:hypothetical protein